MSVDRMDRYGIIDADGCTGCMRSISTAVLGTLGGLVTLWIGWGVYSRWTTARIQYETIDRVDGVERRRYPRSVLVETTASDTGTAFRRLFRYLSGANEQAKDVAMTAPVAITGERASMTAPVRTRRSTETSSTTASGRTTDGGGSVTMAFYLPPEYTPARADTDRPDRATRRCTGANDCHSAVLVARHGRSRHP